MRRRARGLAGLIFIAVGMAPGLVFPVVVAILVGRQTSDTALLAISVGSTLTSIVSNSTEMHAVSALGAMHASAQTLTRGGLRRYGRTVFSKTWPITVGGALLLITVYGATAHLPGEFYAAAALAVGIPLLATFGSVYSAALITAGRTSLSVSTQGLRQIFALLLVLVAPGVSAVMLAAAVIFGEGMRLFALSRLAERRLKHEAQLIRDEGSVLWQVGSLTVTQAGPTTDRAFLAGSTPGAITAYELADKLYYAVLQFVQYGFLTPRVAQWARSQSRHDATYSSRLRHDTLVLVGLSAIFAALAAFIFILVANSGTLPRLQIGLKWAGLVLISLPAMIANTACSRVIILARRQQLLLPLSTAYIALNAACDALFFVAMGPTGIIAASVVGRIVLAFAYALAAHQALTRTQRNEIFRQTE